MNIVLPPKLNAGTNPISIDSKSIVIVCANGSGKTRFGTNIELKYPNITHRISAQKSLSMPDQVSPTNKEESESHFFFGDARNRGNKSIYRWGNRPNNFLLNDFGLLMVLLHTEEYDESVKFKDSYTPGQDIEKPVTKLDRIQRIWELVLPHRKLIKRAGKIETYPSGLANQVYNASEMSDGERVIFYLIGEVVSVPANSLIIVDEPEMHLHKAITKQLWDEIELERTDCSFIYLTHDIDFATSRQNSTKIWMKGYTNNLWDYEFLEVDDTFPEQLYLEIIGSRQPILFIEGEISSVDYKILPLIFTELNVKSVGSCHKVFEITKSFNSQNSFHHIQSFGLIDRDRRTDEEINHINSPNIWVAQVSEIENFLLLEDIVKTVASVMMKSPDEIFESVKVNVISFFKENLLQQALEHTISKIERVFNMATNHKAIKEFAELDESLTEFWNKQNFRSIYDETVTQFEELANSDNYEGILKIFNNKGLIANSRVAALCDLNTKNDAYLNHIISILKLQNNHSEVIKNAIILKIQK